jgi:hypothetical protein
MKHDHPAQALEYPLRVKAGVALAALLCLWGGVESYTSESAYQQQYRDPYRVADQFTRLAAFSSAVPADATVGYINDLEFGNITADAMFQSAQYVLSPRILRKGPDAEVVLGNFTRPADFGAFGGERGLRLERDFGNGVALFRREKR